MAKAQRKQQARLTVRQKRYDAMRSEDKTGSKRPGSMNFKKG